MERDAYRRGVRGGEREELPEGEDREEGEEKEEGTPAGQGMRGCGPMDIPGALL